MTSTSDPITNVFIVTSKENLKPSSSFQRVLSCTQRGFDADLYESSWRSKGKRYLGYEKDPSSSYIVTDALIIKDDDPVPNGFSGIFLTLDSDEKSLKKHILCIKREPRQTATKGVSNFCLINQTKGERADPTFYTVASVVNELNLTFRVDAIQAPSVVPLSHQTQRVNETPLQMPRNTSGQFLNSNTGPTLQLKSPVSAMEGIPFTINPKYKLDTRIHDPIMSSIPKLTVEDINREYHYDFTMEKEFVQRA